MILPAGAGGRITVGVSTYAEIERAKIDINSVKKHGRCRARKKER
jgi:hypothetical protein